MSLSPIAGFTQGTVEHLARLGIQVHDLPESSTPALRNRPRELASHASEAIDKNYLIVRRVNAGHTQVRLGMHSKRHGGDTIDKKILAIAGNGVNREIERRKAEKCCSIKPWHIAILRPQKTETRSRYTDGLTVKAKKTLRQVAAAMEEVYGRENLVFITLTLPGSTEQAMDSLAKNAGLVVYRLQKFLKRNVFSSKKSVASLGVWELQKRGALHLHFLFVRESWMRINWIKRKLQGFWLNILNEISELEQIDLFERVEGGSWRGSYNKIREYAVDCQQVKKSVGAYLVKYLSKDNLSTSQMRRYKLPIVRRKRVLIKQFWFCTDKAREVGKSVQITDVYPVADTYRAVQSLSALLLFSTQFDVKISVSHAVFDGCFVSMNIWGVESQIEGLRKYYLDYLAMEVGERRDVITFYRHIVAPDYLKKVDELEGNLLSTLKELKTHGVQLFIPNFHD